MFLGQYHCSIDEKHFLTVPTHFREVLSPGAYVTQGFERNLMVITIDAFQEIYKRISTMNISDPLARLLLRMLLGNATELKMDEAGRILVPKSLGDFANLENDAMLVGLGYFFEVWDPVLWGKQELRLQDSEANTNRFAALEITA